MEAFFAVILAWAANFMEMKAPQELPEVRFVPLCYIQRVINGPAHVCNKRNGAYAYYDPSHKTIYLPDTWKQDDISDQSVLVHEMVHYVQHINGVHASTANVCIGRDIEMPAYIAQMAWLTQHGVKDVYGTMNLTPFALRRIVMQC